MITPATDLQPRSRIPETIRDAAMKQRKRRFAVGAEVRITMPGMNGVVVQCDDEIRQMGEYWHTVRTEKFGDKREPGCNLELIPKPER